ncbi:MarR family transcriptional regulator [Streptosporangium canum]|uniref:MarR family transcriptional regulator n=1 Tax=Streptosporangium canum TaxID=324952 RepID=UPI0033B2A918
MSPHRGPLRHHPDLTSAELVGRLQVSPASASKAIGYLETIELVRRTQDSGRRERYVIDDDVWLRAFKADTGAHAEVAAAARHGIEIFGAGTPAGTRLGQMARFFAWISEQMNDSGLTDAVVRDALTVLAALVYAARPLTVDDLATALAAGTACPLTRTRKTPSSWSWWTADRTPA